MKIFNITWAVLFVLFAALQYNDPDPYVWVPIYLYGAFMCWKASQQQFYPKAYIIGIIVYAVYALYKVFDQNGLVDWIKLHHAENIAETMKAEKPWVEESREFFGLVILIVVLLINWFYAKKKMKKGAV
ncbi:MAG: transmembrane 220 family protein [Sphingobacteriales bacterium]|nr:transmembrane 220 family protein [Sphingobacteriales bacterium]